jgi:hypothetical protein
MAEPIADWTVYDGYGTTRTFTTDVPAMAYALRTARTDRATLIVAPDGVETLVMRVDPCVQLQAVRNLTGGGR